MRETRLGELFARVRVPVSSHGEPSAYAKRPAAGTTLRVRLGEGKEPETIGLPLIHTLFLALEEQDKKPEDYRWHVSPEDRTAVVADLVKAMVVAGITEALSRFIEHRSSLPRKYPLIPVQVKALEKLKSWRKSRVEEPNEGLSRWLTACRQELEGLTTTMPTEPPDYRRGASIRCKCALCAELAKFLTDPAESTHRFPAPQDRRDHLEQTIRQDQCDVQCTTEKKRRPYTLVCTKTTATYQRDLKKYRENLEHLALVRSIEQYLPS